MVSLFTRFVARGVQVPAVDPRIYRHTSSERVVDLTNERPAAPADAPSTDTAPEGTRASKSEAVERDGVMASDGEDTAS